MNDPAIALRPVDDLDAHVIPRDWAFARDNAARGSPCEPVQM